MTEAPDQQQAGQAAVNPGPDRLLFQIQTFTARYDPAEDRLRLDAVDAKGHKQALWLTRRLADRVIPVLVSHLEGKTRRHPSRSGAGHEPIARAAGTPDR